MCHSLEFSRLMYEMLRPDMMGAAHHGAGCEQLVKGSFKHKENEHIKVRLIYYYAKSGIFELNEEQDQVNNYWQLYIWFRPMLLYCVTLSILMRHKNKFLTHHQSMA